ncbi:MAG: MerR family transcriptional regulator [Clostridia bacterium]|nr:MerR family transcriptional regulator [Clostridia bacterium]
MKELNEEKLKNSSKKFRVNEVTGFFGITPRILKHYEDTGVLNPERAEGNSYREYSAEEVIKIQLAERLKSTQFSQREIAEYFSGGLDIDKKYAELVALRKTIDDIINVLEVDIRRGEPQFSIQEEQTLLCFCKTYPASPSFLQQYLDARDAYSAAISAGCVCDVTHNFFNQYNDLMTFPTVEEFDGEYFKDKTYRICIPIITPPTQQPIDGTVETVIRKKSLVMKFALTEPTSDSRILMAEEVVRRGVMPTGKSWVIPETGPHKKTAKHTYTAVAGVEIEDEQDNSKKVKNKVSRLLSYYIRFVLNKNTP